MQYKKTCFFAAILCIALLALCACRSPAAPGEATAPATETPTLPIEYPASYKDAPEAYWPVLNDLLKCIYLAENYRDYNIWDDWGLHSGLQMLLDSMLSARRESIGYAIQDINEDNTPELIILHSPPDGKLYPLALFTLQDNAPIHLYTYHYRETGSIAEDGTIYASYAVGGGGGMSSFKLEPGAAELTMLTEYEYSAYDDDVEEMQALQKRYYNPPNPMKLNFISIEQ